MNASPSASAEARAISSRDSVSCTLRSHIISTEPPVCCGCSQRLLRARAARFGTLVVMPCMRRPSRPQCRPCACAPVRHQSSLPASLPASLQAARPPARPPTRPPARPPELLDRCEYAHEPLIESLLSHRRRRTLRKDWHCADSTVASSTAFITVIMVFIMVCIMVCIIMGLGWHQPL